MTRLFKVTVMLVLALLLLIALSFVSVTLYQSKWFVYLLFLLPVLWVLWLVCAALEARNPVWRLVLLWCLIDLVVLGMLYQLIGVDESNGASGEAPIFVIAFSPFVYAMWVLSFVGHMLDPALDPLIGKSGYFVQGTSAVFRNWLAMSIATAALSAAFAGGCRAIVAWIMTRKSTKIDGVTN